MIPPHSLILQIQGGGRGERCGSCSIELGLEKHYSLCQVAVCSLRSFHRGPSENLLLAKRGERRVPSHIYVSLSLRYLSEMLGERFIERNACLFPLRSCTSSLARLYNQFSCNIFGLCSYVTSLCCKLDPMCIRNNIYRDHVITKCNHIWNVKSCCFCLFRRQRATGHSY